MLQFRCKARRAHRKRRKLWAETIGHWHPHCRDVIYLSQDTSPRMPALWGDMILRWLDVQAGDFHD